MIEDAEDGGLTGELLGNVLCTEGARILSRYVGPVQAKQFLEALIETLDKPRPDIAAGGGSLSVH